MPLPFATVCDLLEQSYDLSLAHKDNTRAVVTWFERHRTRINAHDTSLSALLSTMLPEKRTDRVYAIQNTKLEKIIGRALMLGASRIAELATYKKPGLTLDLGDCVQRILNATPNPTQHEQFQVTVEEVDDIMHGLASRIRWSSPSIRSMGPCKTGDGLENLYRRLSARDAKWFTRLVLKTYQPLIFDSHLVYKCCNPALPFILKIREDFNAALDVIQRSRSTMLPNSAQTTLAGNKLLATVKPKIGVKVGRQFWLKGRSINHCIKIGSGRMSVENKVDGEYCQIHIPPGGRRRDIQIFSKSGKDSTEDRNGLFHPISVSLRLDSDACKAQEGCILEGELVVYNHRDDMIMPFHKIRSHVARRGRFMNIDMDSQPKPWERLMIVYYDILLYNGRSMMNVRHSERFKILQGLIHCERGVCEIVNREVIDFDTSLGVLSLRKAFAKTIVNRGEGLVLRYDEPYIVVNDRGAMTSGRCIKLKKEYIGSFGDVGDFAVVGAGFSSTKAKEYDIPGLKWTHFYIGCLNNKEEVKRWNTKPEFTVVNAVELSPALLRTFINYANPTCVSAAENDSTSLIMASGIESPVRLSIVFSQPAVFDLRCFSFDKVGNTGFWSLRFPSVTKVHFDRDWTETVAFEELQRMAKESTEAPEIADSQENLAWIARLEGADPRGIAVDAVSQLTATTMPTPSPAKSSQMSKRQQSESQNSEKSDTWKRSLARDNMPKQVVNTTTSNTPTTSNTIKRSSPSPSQPPDAKRSRQYSQTIEFPVAILQNRQPLVPIDLDHSQVSNLSQSFSTPRHSISAGHEQDVDENSPPKRQITDSESRLQSFNEPILSATSTIDLQGCTLAGAKCQLASITIAAYSESLSTSEEVQALLRKHGVKQQIPSIDTWRKADSAATVSKGQVSSILLVDTLNKTHGTEALLAELYKVRASKRAQGSAWIAVYDWRVLRNIGILEDESIQKKSYDGFQDPWRRWYCGEV